MMAYTSNLRVLTANRLADGRVVYLGDDGWTGEIALARLIFDDTQAAAAEHEAQEAVAARLVVEPYLIDVEAEQGGVQPQRLRERIRADGPTTGNSRQKAA
jgi:hypothetical protein